MSSAKSLGVPDSGSNSVASISKRDLGRDAGVYAGSTSLSHQVFGRHSSSGVVLERCGFARPGTTRGDS
jgi:hypothetical protein